MPNRRRPASAGQLMPQSQRGELIGGSSKGAARWMLILATAICTGCTPRTDRLPISGTVALDGKPLDGGSIRFTSEGEQELMTTGAVILDGRYQIPRDKGLRPGTYRVEITAPDSNARPVMVKVKPNQPPIPLPPERIPRKYNVDSQETVEVSTDSDNHFVFEIVSNPGS